jgi:hypothetical protein
LPFEFGYELTFERRHWRGIPHFFRGLKCRNTPISVA